MTYQKTQRGTALCAVLLAIAFVVLVLGASVGQAKPALAFVALLTAGLAVAFSTLTIRVTPDAVAWWLTLKPLGGRIPLAEIATVTIQPFNPLLHLGWHVGRGETSWLIAGDRAVVLTRRNGRQVLLSSDDAHAVVSAIERAQAGSPIA